MSKLLEGKVAVITGAGGGIGRAHALAFAKEGAKVVVNDLGGNRAGQGAGSALADAVVAEIKALGGEAVGNYDSVASMAGGENLVKTALSAFGKIDILVNNAGILRDKTLLKMDEESWDVVQLVHLKGTFACTKAAAQVMKDQGTGGRIINTSSMSGLMGNFGQSNYGAAKAGIFGFTRVCSMELGRYGITVNAIAPVALTRMTEDIAPIAAMGDTLPPEAVSQVVVYLASDQAAHLNGQVFGVGGGRVFQYRMYETQGIIKNEGYFSWNELAERINELTGQKPVLD